MLRRTGREPEAVGHVPPSDDSDFLSLGASVSMNDDLRRTLVAEIEDISKSSQKLTDATNVETKIHEQALKDHSHANNEMTQLKTNAAETLDVIKTSEQIRFGLESTLKSQLMSSKNPQDSDAVSAANDDNRMEEQGQENVAPNASNSLSAIRKAHSKHRQLKREVDDEVEKHIQVFRLFCDEKKAVKESHVAAKRQENGLQRNLSKVLSDVNYNHQEFEKEVKRTATLEARKKAFLLHQEEFAKQEEELDKALSSKKNADSAKEAEMLKRLATIEEEERRKTKLLADRDAELAEKTKQFEELKTQLEEAGSISHTCKDMKEKREHERAERNKLYSQKVEWEAQMTATKDKLSKANSIALKYNEDLAKIEEETEANDAFEAEQILPAKSEYSDLVKGKQQLLELIKAANEGLENDEIIKAAQEHKEHASKMAEDAQVLVDELDGQVSMLNERNRILDDQHDANKKSLKESEDFKKELEDKVAVEQDRIDDHKESKKARFAKHKHGELLRKSKVMEYGAEVLRSSKAEERKLAMRDDFAEIEDEL